MASVDWSKYGGSNEGSKEKKESKSSVDWSRYGTTEQPKNGYSQADRSNAQPYRPNRAEELKAAQPSIDSREKREREQFERNAQHTSGQTTEKRSTLGKVADTIGDYLDFRKKTQDWTENLLAGHADTMTFGALPKAAEELAKATGAEIDKEKFDRARNSTAYKIGEVTGYIQPAAAIERVAARALKPAIGNLGRVTRGAITGTTAGLVEAAAQEAGDVAFRGREFDPENVALGGAIGGVAGAVLPALGALMRRRGVAENTVNEVLALPGPRQRGNVNRVQTPDVIYDADARPIGLPEPSVVPTTARVARRANPYRQQFETLIERARQFQAEGRFTPGREDEELRSLWSQMAGPESPSLEELIDLAYKPRPNRLQPDLAQRARNYQRAREVAGAPLPVRPRVIDPQVVGNVAAPTVRIGRAPGTNPLQQGAFQAERTVDRPRIDITPQVVPDPTPISVERITELRQAAGQADAEWRSFVNSMNEKYKVQLEKMPYRGWTDFATPEEVNRVRELFDKTEETTTNYRQAQRGAREQRSQVGTEPQAISREETTAASDDIADDIELPAPDEIAPRVRDRVNSLADTWINEAKTQWQNKQRLGFAAKVETPDAVILAKMGAGYMLKGAVKLADFTEAMVREFGEEIRPQIRSIFKAAKEEYKRINKEIESEELGLKGFESQELKDLTNLNLNTADVYRNFRKVFGEHFPSIKKAVLDPFDRSKGEYAQTQKDLTNKLYTDIVKGLGIRKGSKESALVQRYGEGQIDLAQLQREAKDWRKIVEADKWFRAQYNALIDRVNESIRQIYPNNPDKLVPYRSDYYRHFQELKGWGGLVNLFDTTSAKISPSLSGMSPFTQPKSKWASFKQRRGLGEFTNDAVGGFLDYIPAASYAIHIDPHISVFRNLAKRLAQDTEQTANINNFIKFLNNFANDLSGKTSPIDRWVEEVGGRNALRIMTKVNNRVKSNVILGNVRSTLSQMANIPNGIAYGGVDAPIGAWRTIESVWRPNEAMAKSNFMRERYIDKDFRRFNTKFWEQPRRFAEFMMESTDRIGTSFVWNTAYTKALRQKVADPVKFADEQTRRLIGGRGVGEQPLLIKSKVFNLVAPFQLEVNNLWRVMKDFVDEKRFGGLVTLLVSNWLLNKAFEQVTGSGVVFDPIDAIVDASTEEDVSVLQRGGRVAGEILSNVPFGQTIASIYPEYGTNFYGAELPTRKELFGEKDPTRFGSGLLATGAITDPLFKFVLPFGGNQLKKTTQGLDAMLRGGAYTKNVLSTGLKNEEPELKFPVRRNLADGTRSVLFGPYATTEGHRYATNDRRPLSAKDTQAVLNAPNQKELYDRIMNRREVEKKQRKLAEEQAKR